MPVASPPPSCSSRSPQHEHGSCSSRSPQRGSASSCSRPRVSHLRSAPPPAVRASFASHTVDLGGHLHRLLVPPVRRDHHLPALPRQAPPPCAGRTFCKLQRPGSVLLLSTAPPSSGNNAIKRGGTGAGAITGHSVS
ncbi:uncharacterized protein [Triticum aestivum]|uniref:uncharacterized protein n=1 Tax=Triticum aestivum TaxID=4565 RepID=UPI001D024370|nr:uncharacterized protein LOC123105094 [Triticum aestivum]